MSESWKLPASTQFVRFSSRQHQLGHGPVDTRPILPYMVPNTSLFQVPGLLNRALTVVFLMECKEESADVQRVQREAYFIPSYHTSTLVLVRTQTDSASRNSPSSARLSVYSSIMSPNCSVNISDLVRILASNGRISVFTSSPFFRQYT